MQDFTEQYSYLIKEKERLTHELEQLDGEARSSEERREGSPFGKREEEATEVFELEKRLAVEHQITDTLTLIDHAIEKYEAGTYGICDSCGQPIEQGRLEALPHASLCLKCKSNLEKDHRGRTR
ncbi:MAG: TraR/DksA C4-type zinc finger protein [Dehalococcoidia bacterium]